MQAIPIRPLHPKNPLRSIVEMHQVRKDYPLVYLPAPGSWNDTSFTASGLANLSDRSMIPRLDYNLPILTYLNHNAFVMGHLGSPKPQMTFQRRSEKAFKSEGRF